MCQKCPKLAEKGEGVEIDLCDLSASIKHILVSSSRKATTKVAKT